MLLKIFGTAASFVLFTAALLADTGSVSRVDSTNREIDVVVGETTHTVRAADVRLLDKDGNEATLGDFSDGSSVDVTVDENGKVTKIQLQ